MDQNFPFHWRFGKLSMLMTFDITTMLGEEKGIVNVPIRIPKPKMCN